MRDAVTAYVGLGANLGDARATVCDAIVCIGDIGLTTVTRASSLYRSAPVESSGPDYVNAVVEIRTALTAPELLARLQAIEAAARRERPYRNAPRTLDLDLLLYGGAHIDSAHLQVPHPRMRERAFVLVPLAEIAPQRVTAEQLRAVSGQALALLRAAT